MNKAELKELRELVENLTDQLEELESQSIRNRRIKCTSNCYGKGCGRMMKISSVDYIQTMHYVEPYSCSGGDYWRDNEGQFDCKHCGHRNRLYDRKEYESLCGYFKSVVYSHDSIGWPPKVDEKKP